MLDDTDLGYAETAQNRVNPKVVRRNCGTWLPVTEFSYQQTRGAQLSVRLVDYRLRLVVRDLEHLCHGLDNIADGRPSHSSHTNVATGLR